MRTLLDDPLVLKYFNGDVLAVLCSMYEPIKCGDMYLTLHRTYNSWEEHTYLWEKPLSDDYHPFALRISIDA